MICGSKPKTTKGTGTVVVVVVVVVVVEEEEKDKIVVEVIKKDKFEQLREYWNMTIGIHNY